MLPKDNSGALSLLKLSIVVTISFTIFFIIVIPFIPSSLYSLLGQEKLSRYIWIVPIGILLLGLVQSFTYYHNRNKNYKVIASNKVLQNSSIAGVNLSAGVIQPNVWGLVCGYLTGQLVSLLLLIKKSKLSFGSIRSLEIKEVAKEYLSFPLFLAPMLLLNTLSVNILVYMLTVFYDQQTVGLYSQAIKAIGYPLFFITASFSSVFYQKLNESPNKIKIYSKSLLYSILTGFLILLPVIIWGKGLFALVFGNQWSLAGEMASILCPLTIFSFAVNNVSEVFSVMQKNHILLIWQIFYLIIAIFLIYYFRSSGIKNMLIVFSATCSMLYILLAIIGYAIIKKKAHGQIDF
jgi:O-antigen/teichoic acid export membrane protein